MRRKANPRLIPSLYPLTYLTNIHHMPEQNVEHVEFPIALSDSIFMQKRPGHSVCVTSTY